MEKKLTRQEREKLMHREAIIEAAQKLFFNKGFENTSMEEIARESEFTVRTIYKYFVNKEYLLMAIVEKGCQKAFSFFKDRVYKETTGLDKVRAVFFAYYSFQKDFPEMEQLMSYFSYLKTGKEKNPIYKNIEKLNESYLEELKIIIKEGKSDGSINGEIDVEKAAYTIHFSLKSFFHEMSVSGKSLPNKDEFSQFAIDLLSKIFK
jgi:AcrR family transcriptional regulator